MSTIAFYGDSFCASDREDSWCVILADLLDSKIQRLGVGGSSIWHTFLEFERDLNANNLADHLIFCWTDGNRLYHPTLPLTVNNKPIEGTDPNVWKAANDYYRYLSFKDKDDIAYKYALQFFDQNVLKNLDISKNIVQMWSMLPFDIELKSGYFMNESCLIHSWDGDITYKGKPDLNLSNHMTTEQNKNWAKKVFDYIPKKVISYKNL
jgi:hypothetical protein